MKKIIEFRDQRNCPYYKDAGRYYNCTHEKNWCQPCERHGGTCPLEEVE
jgi:hypothetical protein